MSFLDFSILDALDILLTAFLLYQIFRLVKGTVAIKIVIGIAAIFLFWRIVKVLDMVLLSEILGNFIGLGFIVLIIVFQQEIRKFLLYLGSANFSRNNKFIKRFLKQNFSESEFNFEPIINACRGLAETKTGALIVITRTMPLGQYTETGESLQANVSSRLIESIFQKESPLHDGAIIITNKKIEAAGCILPVSEDQDIPRNYGLRHRAALGVTEKTDAICIAISEERGLITLFHDKVIKQVNTKELNRQLQQLFS